MNDLISQRRIFLYRDIIGSSNNEERHIRHRLAKERQVVFLAYTAGRDASTPRSRNARPRRTGSSRLPSTAEKASVRPIMRNAVLPRPQSR